MAIRYARFAIPAVNAGVQSGPQNIKTFDDNIKRKLTGFLMTNQTKLIHVQGDVAGRVFFDIDGGLQAQQRDWITIDQDYPSGILFSVNVINDSAANLNANVDAIVLRYSVEGFPGTPTTS